MIIINLPRYLIESRSERSFLLGGFGFGFVEVGFVVKRFVFFFFHYSRLLLSVLLLFVFVVVHDRDRVIT